MLTILPVIILLLAAAAILILQRVKPGFGYAWMTGTIATVIAWGLILAMRWIKTTALVINGWQPLPNIERTLVFQFDTISWSYAFALASLALAILLTLSARLRPDSDTRIWARNLIVIGIGILAVLSGNALTFAITWTAIDIVELATILNVVRTPRQSLEAILAFGIRSGGTLALLWAMAVSASQGLVFTFADIPPLAALFLLIGAGLRLGVLPLNLPYQEEVPLRRGIATALRIVSAVSSLAILARLPQNAVTDAWQPYLLAFSTLAALYGAAMWAAASDELSGRIYWIISFSAMSIGCVVQGQPQSSLIWGLALILGGSIIFLYNARGRKVVWLPILMLVSLSGLPFTLTASGWAGLLGSPLNSAGIFFLLALALLLLGYVRHCMHPGEPLQDKERWAQTIYPVGLTVLIIPAWLIPAVSGNSMLTLGVWWAGPIMLTLAALAFLLFYRVGWSRPPEANAGWFVLLAKRAGKWLARFSSLNWLYQFMWWVYRQAAGVIQIITVLLEGDGGVLWVVVLLTLLIALINTGGG